MPATLKPPFRTVYAILALSWLGNGAWMLFAPAHWFAAIPGSSDTGPLNEHFVRDFGAVFLLIGVAALVMLARGSFSYAHHWCNTALFGLHAGVHAWELSVGRTHWHGAVRDFPLVFLPLLILLGLALPGAWEPREKPAPPTPPPVPARQPLPAQKPLTSPTRTEPPKSEPPKREPPKTEPPKGVR